MIAPIFFNEWNGLQLKHDLIYQVFYADENDGRIYDEQMLRKQELRELKMLQKDEQKKFQDLTIKAQVARDQQDRRFDQETTSLQRGYDTELDTLTRSQKQQVERAEQQQESDLRISSKKIRSEQVFFSSSVYQIKNFKIKLKFFFLI